MTVRRSFMRTILFLFFKIPVGSIPGSFFIGKIDKRTDQGKRTIEHSQLRWHTGNRTVKHHTHQQTLDGIVPVVSQGQFITSVFFRNPEQGLPAIPRTHKTDRFTGIFFYGNSNRTMYKLYSQLFTKLPYILTVDFVSDIFHSNMSSHNRIILFRITGPQCQYFQ